MKVYKMEDVMDALNSVPDIKGHAYVELEEKLQNLTPAAEINDCRGCMGASYDPRDCEECNNGMSRPKDEDGRLQRWEV